MTHNKFFISDTHFGHSNILSFLRNDGTPLRPGFSSIEEHDEHLVNQWNSVVKPHDKVYHLGDVAISKKNLVTLKRLNGKKRLIRGNHDIFRTKDYLEYFEEVYGCRVLGPKEGAKCLMIFTHIPLHTETLQRFKVNVHGHLHSNSVLLLQDTLAVEDKRYINVSCERLDDYKPVALEELNQIIDDN